MGIGKRTEWLGGAGAGCNWRRNDEAWDRLGDALEMVKAAAGPPHSKGGVRVARRKGRRARGLALRYRVWAGPMVLRMKLASAWL